MPFPVTCPSCRHTSQVPDSLGGTQARCPMCGTVVDLPEPEPKKLAVPAKKTMIAPNAVKSAPVEVAAPQVEEEVPLVFTVPDEPSGNKKKTSYKEKSSALPLLLVVGGVLLFFCCGGGGVGAYFLYQRGSRAVSNRFDEMTAQGTNVAAGKTESSSFPKTESS